MQRAKKRKTYLQADENINTTVKYRVTKKIIRAEETSNQDPQDDTCCQKQIQIRDISILNPITGEPHHVMLADHGVREMYVPSSYDGPFDASEVSPDEPKNLQDLLHSPGFCDTITISVERSPAELLLLLLKYSISTKLSLTSISNLMRLINSVFATPVIPESRHMIDKFFNSNHNAEFHASCSHCDTYVGKFGTLSVTAECTNCHKIVDVSKPSSGNYYAIVDPSDAIADYLSAYEDYYTYVMHERRHEKGHIKDVYDGSRYREFLKNLPETAKRQYVTASFNTDGAPVFESSTYSIWPIYLMLNELPVEQRLKNLIVCGLWFGKSKPQMSVFLDSFVDKINHLSTTGIPCTVKGESLSVKLYALICCVDTVARSPMNGTMQFNAFYGCDWCLHPGEWHDGCVRYPVLESISASRDMRSTFKLMKEAVEKGLPVFGIRNVSPLIMLYCFDLIEGCVPDYLHCYLLGVVKQLTEYTIKSISVNDFQILESRLSKMKAPNQLGRLSRALKDRTMWKAREWENWLLYYSLPVLESIIDEKVLKHWSLLIESLHILLKIDITYAELDEADRMLHEFVCQTEQLYSKSAMTYNVHQLLHVAKSVYNWGPLWAHSTFPFESGNHQLLTAIKCAKGVNQQILRHLNIQRSIDILEKKLYPHSSDIVKHYCSTLANPQTKKCLQLFEITYFGSGKLVDRKFLETFGLTSNTQTFMRIIKSGCLYASIEKENLRSCNSFAQLTDRRYIQIISFVVDLESDNELAICNFVQTTRSEYSDTLRKITEIDNEVSAVKTIDIDKTCVFVHVTDSRYICSVPNLYKY